MRNRTIKAICIGEDFEGKGIVKEGGQEFHIPNLIEGEVAKIEILRTGKFQHARLMGLYEKSKYRASPPCPYYGACGGCQIQHMTALGQAYFKQRCVEKLLKKYHKVNDILVMDQPYYYRHKINSTPSYDKRMRIVSGIYQEYTHRVVPVESCMIQDRAADEIIASILRIMRLQKLKPYDEDTGGGFLRHILIRTGFFSRQVMVMLVVSSPIFPGKNNFVNSLLKMHPEITTIVMNVNNRKTSIVLGGSEKVLYGRGYIEDMLCGCVFQISPRSFYQVNPMQTEILYNSAIGIANLNGNETVLDAYCGIGTISLILSGRVKRVIGVELNRDAVRDAIRNAKRSGITNASFYNDDAGKFMFEAAARREKIDVVFMDPPRSGSGERFLSSLAHLSPKKIVYISCNPVTQERDVRFLAARGYRVEEIQPVDMFPQTSHVETVVLMSRVKD